MGILSSLGMLKVDFLGLITLTVMAKACDLINKRHGKEFNLNNIPLDDPQAYALIGAGNTAGLFQLEGGGMTRYIVQMKPKTVEHVIAMVALYRPGPMQFIPDYIARMHGEAAVEYRHESLRPIYESTYGIPIYQEQLMRAAIELGGYTPSESDELRSAISKKKADKIEKHRAKFIAGATAKGLEQPIAEAIYKDWEEFARYGFNHSHAADYGVIAVETAYLKAHYPAEYLTALLSASKSQTDKVAYYVADARSMGVPVLPPDVNASGWDFEIEDRDRPAIRFGLGAIKNVGEAAVNLISDARKKDGAFKDLNDLRRPRRPARCGQARPRVPHQSGSDGFVRRPRRVAGGHGARRGCQRRALPRRRRGQMSSSARAQARRKRPPARCQRSGPPRNPQLGARTRRHVPLRPSAHALPENPHPTRQLFFGATRRSQPRGKSARGGQCRNHPSLHHQNRQADGLRHHRRHSGRDRTRALPKNLGKIPACAHTGQDRACGRQSGRHQHAAKNFSG